MPDTPSHATIRAESAADPAASDGPNSQDRDSDAAALSDKTVISNSPPIVPQQILPPFKPHELGATLVGRRLGDFQLEEFIGGGGMGAVFRAVDQRLNRTVAVKVVSSSQASQRDAQRRLKVEAQSAARLDHPHIARVHSVGEDGGLHFIVFEYIDGTNVRELVGQYGPLSLAEALRYTLQIADALVHAWQRNVVHRDIKPSNILITANGHAKLVDMGLARLYQVDQSEHDLTASGVTLGTFDYISPEQARDPRVADTRSDIYSLGCTLFYMLTSRPPFPDGTMLQKLLMHQGDDPPDIQEIRPDVPESVVELLDTMLAKRAEQRFQTPTDLVAALISISEQLGISTSGVAMTGAWLRPLPRHSWSRQLAPWMISAALLGVGVVGLEAVWSRGETATVFDEQWQPSAQRPGAGDGTETQDASRSPSMLPRPVRQPPAAPPGSAPTLTPPDENGSPAEQPQSDAASPSQQIEPPGAASAPAPLSIPSPGSVPAAGAAEPQAPIEGPVLPGLSQGDGAAGQAVAEPTGEIAPAAGAAAE